MKKTSIILIHSLPDRKIKSLGNRALISIGKEYIIDYQIHWCKKLCHSSEIIVVGAFESKKLQKYLSKKHPNIQYISHSLTEYTNIGLSIQKAMQHITGNNILVANGNILIEHAAISKIKKQMTQKKNFLITTKQAKSSIGYIDNSDSSIAHCFFDLPKPIYDMLYIDSSYIDNFSDIIYNHDFEKYYLFEIINHCIEKNLIFYTLDIDSRHINIIDNNDIISKLIRKRKKYA